MGPYSRGVPGQLPSVKDGTVYNMHRYLGVKPLIHQSELRTYTNVVLFEEKNIECNGTSIIGN